jgi:hypothetical protein
MPVTASSTIATQDPLLTAVGLATFGVAMIAIALAAKGLLRAAWLLSTRRRTDLATVVATPRRPAATRPTLQAPATGSAVQRSPHLPAPDPAPATQADSDADGGDALLLKDIDIAMVAEAAGAGEVAHQATRSLDDMLAVMEASGWIALHELLLDGVRVRHALIGPGGAFAFQTRLPRWTMGDIALADIRAGALAWTLAIPEEDVEGVVVLPGSSEAPRYWYGAGSVSACVIGEHQLVGWLQRQPRRLGSHDLCHLAEGIDRVAAAARGAPRTLGEVHQG